MHLLEIVQAHRIGHVRANAFSLHASLRAKFLPISPQHPYRGDPKVYRLLY